MNFAATKPLQAFSITKVWTVLSLENSLRCPTWACDETGTKIISALESVGVQFIDENGGGPGVRLRKRQQKKT